MKKETYKRSLVLLLLYNIFFTILLFPYPEKTECYFLFTRCMVKDDFACQLGHAVADKLGN